MTLSTAPSESISENDKFSAEALARVNTVANEAISILAGNPDAESALKNTFHSMIAGNLRNPENIGKILD
jgi:hypothetical protein